MASKTRVRRIQFMLTSAELAAVDDFRFEHRMPNRATALRELMQRGLAAGGKVATKLQSRDYGVLVHPDRKARQ